MFQKHRLPRLTAPVARTHLATPSRLGTAAASVHASPNGYEWCKRHCNGRTSGLCWDRCYGAATFGEMGQRQDAIAQRFTYENDATSYGAVKVPDAANYYAPKFAGNYMQSPQYFNPDYSTYSYVSPYGNP